MSDAKPSEYAHSQRGVLCVLLYGLAAIYLVLGFFIREAPIGWLFPPIGLVMLIFAASIHHLTVEDQGDRLAIRFGPIPLFRRTVRYADIESAEVGQTLLLDGIGIHYSVRGGWVWNIAGRSCVVIHFRDGRTLRIGTDDADNLTAFIRSKIGKPMI